MAISRQLRTSLQRLATSAQQYQELVRLFEHEQRDVAGGPESSTSSADIALIERAKHEWQATADWLADLVCLLDPKGKIVRVNGICEAWNLARVEKVEGMTVHALMHGDCSRPDCYFQDEWAAAWRVVKAGRIADFETYDHHLATYFQFRLRPAWTRELERPKGGRVFAVVVVSDITDARTSRLALRDSEERYRLLAEHANDIISRLDPTFSWLYCSPACNALLGRPPETLLGKSMVSLAHPDDAAQVEAALSASLNQPTGLTALFRLRRADGSYRWFETTFRPVADSRYRAVSEIVAISRDVSGRVEAEERLRHSEARLAETQRLAHIGSWEYEAADDRMTWSDEIFRILGATAEGGALDFRKYLANSHPDDRDAVRRCFGEAVRLARPFELNHRAVRPDGSICHVHTTGHPVTGVGGTVERVVGTALDITELKRAEETLREARELEVAIGERIQRTLLLGSPPRLSGFEIAALTRPSRGIDGDFYDFYPHGPSCCDVLVGDVMGKGVPAALMAAATKASFMRAMVTFAESGRREPPGPAELVTAVAGLVGRQLEELESFLPLVFARFDRERLLARLVDGGHTKTIHVHAGDGALVELAGDNLPLGVLDNQSFTEIEVRFADGDVFVFYSDGITEARGAGGEMYGTERLAAAVRQHAGLPASELVATLYGDVVRFSSSDAFADDLTCVVVRVVPPATAHEPERRAIEVASSLDELSRARAFVTETAGTALPEAAVGELVLAFNEALVNVIIHAYERRTDRRVLIEVASVPGDVTVTLTHWGADFDPASVPPPLLDGSQEHGYGIFIIASTVDEVHYGDGPGGAHEIVMRKRTPPAAQR